MIYCDYYMCKITRGYCLGIVEIKVFKKELALMLHYILYSILSILLLKVIFWIEYHFYTIWIYIIYLKHKTIVGDIFDFTIYVYIIGDLLEHFISNGDINKYSKGVVGHILMSHLYFIIYFVFPNGWSFYKRDFS